MRRRRLKAEEVKLLYRLIDEMYKPNKSKLKNKRYARFNIFHTVKLKLSLYRILRQASGDAVRFSRGMFKALETVSAGD
jgi:hypothetical protein